MSLLWSWQYSKGSIHFFFWHDTLYGTEGSHLHYSPLFWLYLLLPSPHACTRTTLDQRWMFQGGLYLLFSDPSQTQQSRLSSQTWVLWSIPVKSKTFPNHIILYNYVNILRHIFSPKTQRLCMNFSFSLFIYHKKIYSHSIYCKNDSY